MKLVALLAALIVGSAFLVAVILVDRLQIDEERLEIEAVTTNSSTTTSTTTTSSTPTTVEPTTTTTHQHPVTTVARVARSAPTPRTAPQGDIWERLAACESGGRWHIFDRLHSGGLQFAYATWRQAGGTRFAPTPHEASREQQIQVAREWLRRTSPRQWPVCGPRVGLTMGDAA